MTYIFKMDIFMKFTKVFFSVLVASFFGLAGSSFATYNQTPPVGASEPVALLAVMVAAGAVVALRARKK